MHDRISVNHLCFLQSSVPDFSDCLAKLSARRVSLLGAHLLAPGGVEMAKALIASGPYIPETITHNFQSRRHIGLNEEDWLQPRAALSRLIENAAEIGARSIYMVTGGHGDLLWEDAAHAFAGAIAPCVMRARELGVTLMVETANPFMADVHIAHNLADTIKLAQIAGVNVCIDLFAIWGDSNLRELIHKAAKGCAIVQLSDYSFGDRIVPGRTVPGDGAMPLKRLLGWVMETGYSGAFDLELGGQRITDEGPLTATQRAADYVGNVLAELGV